MIQQSGRSEQLQLSEAKGLLDIITHYTQRFILLNQYDSHSLAAEKLNENITYEIKYEEAGKAIAELKKQLISKKEASGILAIRKMRVSKEFSAALCRPLEKNICIRALRSKRHTFYISPSKIIRSTMETNALGHFYLFGFWKRTNTVSRKTESLRSMTMPWWRWRCLLHKAILPIKN